MDADLLRRLRNGAEVSVARACGFAGLATLCLMIGLAGDLATCLRGGGYAALLVCTVLLVKAAHAPLKPFKQTELWRMLDPPLRPAESHAQALISGALRRQYLRFALFHAIAGATMLILALLVSLRG